MAFRSIRTGGAVKEGTAINRKKTTTPVVRSVSGHFQVCEGKKCPCCKADLAAREASFK
jgi:hypothetical protein